MTKLWDGWSTWLRRGKIKTPRLTVDVYFPLLTSISGFAFVTISQIEKVMPSIFFIGTDMCCHFLEEQEARGLYQRADQQSVSMTKMTITSESMYSTIRVCHSHKFTHFQWYSHHGVCNQAVYYCSLIGLTN
jgi:hypothetical protein